MLNLLGRALRGWAVEKLIVFALQKVCSLTSKSVVEQAQEFLLLWFCLPWWQLNITRLTLGNKLCMMQPCTQLPYYWMSLGTRWAIQPTLNSCTLWMAGCCLALRFWLNASFCDLVGVLYGSATWNVLCKAIFRCLVKNAGSVCWEWGLSILHFSRLPRVLMLAVGGPAE